MKVWRNKQSQNAGLALELKQKNNKHATLSI